MGLECYLACDVDFKYASKGGTWVGAPTVGYFKNFDTKDATGFKTSSFLGRYISELVIMSEGER